MDSRIVTRQPLVNYDVLTQIDDFCEEVLLRYFQARIILLVYMAKPIGIHHHVGQYISVATTPYLKTYLHA